MGNAGVGGACRLGRGRGRRVRGGESERESQPGYWRRVTGWWERKTGTRRHLTCLPTRQSSLRGRSSAGSTSGYSIATARRARSLAYSHSLLFFHSAAYHGRVSPRTLSARHRISDQPAPPVPPRGLPIGGHIAAQLPPNLPPPRKR